MNQIQRIETMEKNLDLTQQAIQKLSAAFEAYEQVQDAYKALSDYYESAQWMQDFEDDEAGKLPKDLKRGVLSEDAVWNLLSDTKEMNIRLLETVAEILKKK